MVKIVITAHHIIFNIDIFLCIFYDLIDGEDYHRSVSCAVDCEHLQ